MLSIEDFPPALHWSFSGFLTEVKTCLACDAFRFFSLMRR
jgi:hypothetical protein